ARVGDDGSAAVGTPLAGGKIHHVFLCGRIGPDAGVARAEFAEVHRAELTGIVGSRHAEVGRAVGAPIHGLHARVAIGVAERVTLDVAVAAGVIDDQVGDAVLR